MRDQLGNTAAACACTPCLFCVQVMVSRAPHAFSIKTAGSQLPQSELHVFTKETDTHTQKKPNREFMHFHLCVVGFFFFFSFLVLFFLKSEQDFDVCESGPGQGAEA